MIAEKIVQIEDRLAHEPMDDVLRLQLETTKKYLENLISM